MNRWLAPRQKVRKEPESIMLRRGTAMQSGIRTWLVLLGMLLAGLPWAQAKFTCRPATNSLSSTWALANEVRYVYDGRLVVEERDGANQPRVTYTRGKDLSGSLSGAGGIGGLLARSHRPDSPNHHFYYHADGGGNVTAIINQSQNLVAQYAYDPFGRLLMARGALAEGNPYRFSSKEYHANAGLYYYGFRFYDPANQRWISRDPLGEAGGINLYQFVGNSPLNRVDPLGLAFGDWWDCRTYSSGYARWVGMESLDKQAKANGYRNYEDMLESLDEARGTDSTYRHQQCQKAAIKAIADIASDAANVYVTAATAVTPSAAGAKCVTGLSRVGGKVPKVTESKLGNIVNDLYKGAKGPNPIGIGSTADAVRNELATGLPTHGTFHSQKAQEYTSALNNWLKRNPNASDYDRLVAESLLRDLQSALGGN
jgi:RHS repeat-associated protein